MGSQNTHSEVLILDIRQKESSSSLRSDIYKMLRPAKGEEKRLPTLLLYDEQGLKLFEDITYLEEYYLTNAEIEVLKGHADDIAQLIPAGSQILELGSGNLRKVQILLQALERARKDVEYYALDVSLVEMRRTFSAVSLDDYKYVKFRGLQGTYDDGLVWLSYSKNSNQPKVILFLGSSIGNFTPVETVGFLKGFSNVLGSNDAMVIGVDACRDTDKVHRAYDDVQGKTREFYLNGLIHANSILGDDVFVKDNWDVFSEFDENARKHQAFYVATKESVVDGVHVEAGERLRFENAYKYSKQQSRELWRKAGFVPQTVFKNATDDYHLHVLSAPKFSFPLDVDSYAAEPVPSLEEFQQLWAAWDTITRHMIPEEELLSKPINLRNCCLFYMGHIPTFLDIYITGAIHQPATDPAYFRDIFERGIDPDVDDPEKCHKHSEIPDTWPAIDKIFAFQSRVRGRLKSLYKSGLIQKNRKLARSLWLSFEHEVMHLETLLYMLIQSDKILSPPGAVPDFESLSQQARRNAVPNHWVQIPAQKITLGLEDAEDDSGEKGYYGWDNEKPQRRVTVPAFEVKARPITNEEFAQYLAETQQEILPAMWTTSSRKNNTHSFKNSNVINGHREPSVEAYIDGILVKTMYGAIPLQYVLDWPMIASYDELLGCAKWMGGRIPTADEVRSIYSHVDHLKAKEVEGVQSRTISAVNGHLSNNGVQESPPPQPYLEDASSTVHLDPHTLFTNLQGCNVGFKHYHPTPVTQNGRKLSGQADFGGVWEWTSTVLEAHEGFKAMELYPGYTADFFDGKHNIVLGGSWATHPRIAGRKSFVNWYQRNYPFAWAGARLAR